VQDITDQNVAIEMINKKNFYHKNSQNEEILNLKENPKILNAKKEKKLILSGLKNEKKHRYFIYLFL